MIVKKNRGFTLIELMITVTIISVLAAISISSYQTYIGRAQLTEALNLMTGAKVKYAEFIVMNGRIAQNDEGITILKDVATSKYVKQVYISIEGRLGATISNEANKAIRDTNIALEPVLHGGSVSWKCYYYGPQDYVPSSCKDY